jgi:hypothetical protein
MLGMPNNAYNLRNAYNLKQILIELKFLSTRLYQKRI